ncbi:MAG: amidohydrolase family protein, partial [Planctomycetota bacterium]
MNTHKRPVATGFLLLLLLGVSAAQAQPTIVLRADRVLDVDRGKIVRDAVVIIEGDRIKSVGSRDVPADAQQIDLPGMTLLPGLIDMHTHLS